MKKLLFLFGLLAVGPVQAQTPTTPAIAAMVCANNTVVPTPVNGQFFYVQCDSSGKLITTSTGAVPGGANTQVQFNDSGAFGGSSLFTFNKTTGNTTINNYFAAGTTTVSASATTILTAASARYQTLTGTLSQTYQLPDATTMATGIVFVFNNNSSGSLIVTNAGGTTLYTIPAGGAVQGGPSDISTANGVWDFHPAAPATVTWGSGTTGLVMNSALSTTASIGAGAPSSTTPVFIPRRDALTTGIGAQAAGNLSLIASGVEAARVTSSGMALVGLTGAVKANNTGAVTQAACADLSNGGTACAQTYTATPWTPTITTDVTPGTPAYTRQVGSYEQVGRLIVARFTILLSGWTGSPSGNVFVGLPIAAGSATNDRAGCFVDNYSVAGLAVNTVGIHGFILPGGTVAQLQSSGNTGTNVITAAQFGTTGQIEGTCIYHN